jgi:cell division protein FtsB
MSVELLTYADLAERLKTSPEAARSLAKRLRLPRSRGNDGKARVAIDFAEIRYTAMPVRSAAGRRQDTAALKAQIAALQAQVTELEDEAAKLEALAGGHRADYERERDRADRLMTEMLKATADVMTAKEATARFEGELAAWRSRPWWKRVAG